MQACDASTECIIKSADAPPAIGPYSQAIRSGDFVFCSGALGVIGDTGKFAGDTIEAQTEQVLKNLQHVLKAAGLGLESVVKATVFLQDMNQFPAMNEVYGKYFPKNPPARSTVQVARLPKDAMVEIEAIACARAAA